MGSAGQSAPDQAPLLHGQLRDQTHQAHKRGLWGSLAPRGGRGAEDGVRLVLRLGLALDAAAAGPPAQALAGLRESPFWPVLEAVAASIGYDGDHGRHHVGRCAFSRPLAAITVPVLVMRCPGTGPWLITAARALADLLPAASRQAVPGEQHSAAAEVLAPALRQFAQGR